MTGTIPVRIQRKRTKGSRLPVNTVCVTRPDSPFQNRYEIGTHSNWLGRKVATLKEAVDCFENVIIEPGSALRAYAREILAGKNLACWCKLCPAHETNGKPLNETCADCAPCHVDPLGLIANNFTCEAA